MIQQNVIASNTQPIEIHKARVRTHNTLIFILMILGATLMLSLYIYQASALYATRLEIQHKQMEYARQERMNAESLAFYAQTQSMEAMVRRARASGYGPPDTNQINYVYYDNGAPEFIRSDEIVVRR